MKAIKFFILGFTAVLLTSCSGSAVSKQVLGTWKASNADFSQILKSVQEDQKAFVEAMIPQMEQAMESSEMTFAKDGKFTTTTALMGQTMKNEGTYKISKDGKTITMSSNGKTSDFNIESITNEEMKVISIVDSSAIKITWKKIKQATKK